MNRPPTPAARFRPPLQGNPRRTRQEHSQETALDYVELIAELIATAGEARVTDLARRLGVTHVTVNRTIQRLRAVDWSTPCRTAPFSSPKRGGNFPKNHAGVTRLWSSFSSRSGFRTPSPIWTPKAWNIMSARKPSPCSSNTWNVGRGKPTK